MSVSKRLQHWIKTTNETYHFIIKIVFYYAGKNWKYSTYEITNSLKLIMKVKIKSKFDFSFKLNLFEIYNFVPLKYDFK